MDESHRLIPGPFWQRNRSRIVPQTEPQGQQSEQHEWFNLSERLETEQVNPQLSSPLYNGRIPSEIRMLILEFTLTEQPATNSQKLYHDPLVRHNHDPPPEPILTEESTTPGPAGLASQAVRHASEPKLGLDWVRPDNTKPMKIYTEILQTCRRVYLEACTLPLKQKQHVLYLYRGPDPNTTWSHNARIRMYFKNNLGKPSPVPDLKQHDLVRSVRLYTQMFWLEDRERLWSTVTDSPWFKPVERLRISLRRSDWWHWEHNVPPVINPFKGKVTVSEMQADMLAAGGNPEFRAGDWGPWGRTFEHMPNLDTLVIDFETSEDQKEEMKQIVEWAVKWKLPLAGGRQLSADGREVDKMSWYGTTYYWSHRCTECRRSQYDIDENCATCMRRQKLIANDYGPRLYIWTVTWKAVALE